MASKWSSFLFFGSEVKSRERVSLLVALTRMISGESGLGIGLTGFCTALPELELLEGGLSSLRRRVFALPRDLTGVSFEFPQCFWSM